jgi:hypothetical protein
VLAIPRMDAMATVVLKTPKLSGVYSRDKIGETASGIACAMALPDAIVSKSLENERRGIPGTRSVGCRLRCVALEQDGTAGLLSGERTLR